MKYIPAKQDIHYLRLCKNTDINSEVLLYPKIYLSFTIPSELQNLVQRNLKSSVLYA